VRIAARRPECADALTRAVGGRAVRSIAQAVAGAHVVCAATSAAEPVVTAVARHPHDRPPGAEPLPAAVASGTLVTAVGFGGREVGPELVTGARRGATTPSG
jgi:ornithine cyclodeaminase/alanine dehydrogenase-like protein (mu-crystallin family)